MSEDYKALYEESQKTLELVSRAYQEATEAWYQRQQREAAENIVHFAVIDREGHGVLYKSDTFAGAVAASEFYDDCEVGTWTETPIKVLKVAKEERDDGELTT